MPWRSATADSVTPGSSASVKILTFSSALHFRRRFTREMISPTMSLGVLTHVFKDANAHDLRQVRKGSRRFPLTQEPDFRWYIRVVPRQPRSVRVRAAPSGRFP